MKAVSIQVSGKVQGVWFRVSTKNEAEKHNIKGLVRNQPDGSVYIEAEGSHENLNSFTSWCQIGPPSSQVSSVKITEISPKGFHNFVIQK